MYPKESLVDAISNGTAPPFQSRRQKTDSKPTDWEKITTIAVLIIGGLIAGLAYFSISGTFPIEIFGGSTGAHIALGVFGLPAAYAGYVLYNKWKESD